MFKTIAVLVLVGSTALADEYPDQFIFASQLGTLLGSELPCGMSYDIQAVNAYIDANADPKDLSVLSQLNFHTFSTKGGLETMDATAKAAQCRVAARSAAALGFVD